MKTVLSSKGQVVIPREFREEFKWKKGTKLNVQKTLSGIFIFSVPKSPLEKLGGMLENTLVSEKNVKELRKKDLLLERSVHR